MMHEISSIALSVIALVFPIVLAVYFVVKKRNSVISWLFYFVVTFFVCYSFTLMSVKLTDMRIEADLYSHDLNGDRQFSGSEITPEMEAAMSRSISDTGRALAPITAAIFFVPYVGFWGAVFGIPCIISGRKARIAAEQVAASDR